MRLDKFRPDWPTESGRPKESVIHSHKWSFIGYGGAVGAIVSAPDGTMRQVHPLPVALGVDLLKPDAEPDTLGRSVPHARHISPVSNGNVSVHLNFD